MRANAIWQLTVVKIREYVREPEAVFWILVFPVLLSLTLGIAFRSRGPEEIRVAALEGPGAEALAATLDASPDLRCEVLGETEARTALRNGKVALVISSGGPVVYRYDPSREESRLARLAADAALQTEAGRDDPLATSNEEMTEKGSRYIDFLVPGLLGMNLMGTGIWGVGFAIVMARSRGQLKRMIATPMRRSDYLLGQMLGRMIFLVPEVAAIVGFAWLIFDVPVRGSLSALAFLSVVGALVFSGFGLLAASRARTVEGVSGLMNVIMLPMWMLSGVFFSPSRFPDFMQPLVQALPLTALIDALRGVMIDGASLASVAGEVAIVSAWGVAAFVVSLAIFRWR